MVCVVGVVGVRMSRMMTLLDNVCNGVGHAHSFSTTLERGSAATARPVARMVSHSIASCHFTWCVHWVPSCSRRNHNCLVRMTVGHYVVNNDICLVDFVMQHHVWWRASHWHPHRLTRRHSHRLTWRWHAHGISLRRNTHLLPPSILGHLRLWRLHWLIHFLI